jgi:hypothetical protein
VSDVIISIEDVNQLAQRLSELDPGLTPEERTLLAGIFRAAVGVIEQAAAVDVPVHVEPKPAVVVRHTEPIPAGSLKHQFIDAFTPDPAGGGKTLGHVTKIVPAPGSIAWANSIGRTLVAEPDQAGGSKAADRPKRRGA